MTVDAGVLWQATERNIFSKTDSNILKDNVPSYLRDPDGQWFGLSKRARTIVFSNDQFSQNDFSLSDLNPSSDTYGQSIGPSYFSNNIIVIGFFHEY